MGGDAGDEEHYEVAYADRYYDPDKASEKGESHRFEQKLKDNCTPGRPEGFANADLFCAFGDRDEHDIHHTDTADEQPEARDRDSGDADSAHNAVKLGNEAIGGLYVKIVWLAVFYIPALAQNALDLCHRII